VKALHVHLDPVGGLAGDMFCAAMLDAFPALQALMMADLSAAGFRLQTAQLCRRRRTD